MSMKRILALTLLAIGSTAGAQHRPADLTPDEIAVLQTSSFAQAHPDIKFRLSGFNNSEQGQHEAAFQDFMQAARYGDKASQAVIAEAYWNGALGRGQNRALGYAWMDLAAERGYPLLLAKRERYWAALNGSDRDSAIIQGEKLYADFGDAVALPRLNAKLRFAEMQKTGSRVGGGDVQTYLADGSWFQIRGNAMHPVASGGRRIDFWDDQYWDLQRYLAWKDVELDGQLTGRGKGSVNVLPVEPRHGQL